MRILLAHAIATIAATTIALTLPTPVARQDATAAFHAALITGFSAVTIGTRVERGAEGEATVSGPIQARHSRGTPAFGLSDDGSLVATDAAARVETWVARSSKQDRAMTRLEREDAIDAQARAALRDHALTVALRPGHLAPRGGFDRVVRLFEPDPDDAEAGSAAVAVSPFPAERPEPVAADFARLARLSILNSEDFERAGRCLAEAIYFEARGESERGQQAVAQVVINRVKSGRFPASVCDVIYQNRHWRNRCQFSYACDAAPETVRDTRAWELAERVADDALTGRVFLREIGDSTHYHATYVAPRWRRFMDRTERIGTHIFYRVPNWTFAAAPDEGG